MLSPVPLSGRAPTLCTIILNAGSGSQRQQEVAAVLRKVCADFGEISIRLARRPQDIFSFARAAVTGGQDLVVAGGGDGTISAVASVVAGTGCTLGVLPLGTFNYFARRLRIPQELESAVRTCFEGEGTTVSLGEVNGRVFLNNASIGLYPTMLKAREETYRRFGRSQLAAYISGLFSLARTRRYHHVEMTVDGERYSFRTPLVFAASNAEQVKSFGVPGSECLERGNLAFYILPPVGTAGLVRLGCKMVLRRLDPGRDFKVMCAEQVVVDTRRPFVRVAYDGEMETMRSPLVFRWRPDALRVMVPRVAEQGPGEG